LKFQVQNLSQIVFLQAPEDDHLVNPVHELRQKLTPCRFDRCAENFLINVRGKRICRAVARRKTDAARNQFRHLASSEVRCQNHYRAREVNAAVVA
jgi:hypothetical protein